MATIVGIAEKFSSTFAIHDASKLTPTPVPSKSFYLHQLPWNISVFCKDAENEFQSKTLAVSLKCNFPDTHLRHWLCEVKFLVNLVNQNNDQLDRQREVKTVFSKGRFEHIVPNLISWPTLFDEKNRYIENDKIYLQLSLSAKSPKNAFGKQIMSLTTNENVESLRCYSMAQMLFICSHLAAGFDKQKLEFVAGKFTTWWKDIQNRVIFKAFASKDLSQFVTSLMATIQTLASQTNDGKTDNFIYSMFEIRQYTCLEDLKSGKRMVVNNTSIYSVNLNKEDVNKSFDHFTEHEHSDEYCEKIVFTKLPKMLIGYRNLRGCNGLFEFTETVDLKKYAPDEKTTNYSLCAMLIATEVGTHYSIIKFQDEWIIFDESRVFECSENDVIKCAQSDACIFVYNRDDLAAAAENGNET